MQGDGTATVADLRPAGYNPRKITDAQLERLAEAMRRFGDLGGIIRNVRTGNLIGGHQRVRTMDAGAPVVITERFDAPNEHGTIAVGYVEHAGERWTYREVDVDAATEKAMNVAANQHGGSWDMPLLAEVIADLQAAAVPMEFTGFDAAEIEDILAARPEAVPQDEAFDGLTGEAPALEQMTITLAPDQAATVRRAIQAAKDQGPFPDTGNENANGNAIARVAEVALGAFG